MDCSFLHEVLNSEESEFIDVGPTITDLVNQTNILKNDVAIVFENQSLQFNPVLKESTQLKCRAEELLKEMNTLEGTIQEEIQEELLGCTSELESLSCSLKEVNFFLKTLQELLAIDDLLRQSKESMKQKEYCKCAEILQNAKNCIKNNTEKLEKIEIFKMLSQEVTLTFEHLMHTISEIWSSSIKISTKHTAGMELKSTQVILSIQKNICNEFTDILNASSYLEANLNEMKFSKMLLGEILNPIVFKKTNCTVDESENEIRMILEILNESSKPSYLDVFENIKQIINFLKVNVDIKLSTGQNFLSVIGNFISEDFLDSLINKYLSESIPTNLEAFDSYKDVVNNAEKLETSLQNDGFLQQKSSSLMEYARNVNALFANKFCQSFLNKARETVKKDLHHITMSDEVTSDLNLIPSSYSNILKMKLNIQSDIFVFNKCQISKHAQELISLLHLMMVEVEKSMELCGIRLLYTVRNIFEMYCAIVPLYHKKFLETLPQQVALLHNNCLYFAHNLIHTVTVYQGSVPNVLRNHLHILLEVAIKLKNLAAEKLETAVTNQRSQLVYILRDSGFATLNENPKLDPNSEKSIRQCIRQMQMLQNTWKDVLPLNVYIRAIGFLIDTIIEELISIIITVEDISSQTASDLVNYFSVILERAPTLFPDEKEIHRHVRKWQKFNEFILILKGSLRDIDDRWANGMGPLAVEFTPEQVKHLIRALFQNSDRRATLLARIR
ncbi:hypothetical protein RUM44_013140 [Polyplax serrata]|uniref:Centromere/kinetochore protein zw10-like protein n=1 Tax=Polyplax serrata TaxID=468196 RepID=A0ABR1BH00_POLSC